MNFLTKFQRVLIIFTVLQSIGHGETKLATFDCTSKHNQLSAHLKFLSSCKKENSEDFDDTDPGKHDCFLMRWYCTRICTKLGQCQVKSVFIQNPKVDNAGKFQTLDCICGYSQCKKGFSSVYGVKRSIVEESFKRDCSEADEMNIMTIAETMTTSTTTTEVPIPITTTTTTEAPITTTSTMKLSTTTTTTEAPITTTMTSSTTTTTTEAPITTTMTPSTATTTTATEAPITTTTTPSTATTTTSTEAPITTTMTSSSTTSPLTTTTTKQAITLEDCQALLPSYAGTTDLKFDQCVSFINDVKLTWEDAKVWCEQLPNGHLLYLPDSNRDVIYELLVKWNYFYKVWMGLKQIPNSATADGWQWYGENGKIENAGDEIPWGDDEPNDYNGNKEDCGGFSQWTAPGPNMADTECSTEINFVCQFLP